MAWWQRKKGKRSLKEAEETISLLLREFEESGSDWLWQIDASRQFIGVGTRLAQSLKLPIDEIEGKSFLKIMAGDDWDVGSFSSSLHDLASLISKRKAISNFIVQRNLNGATFWYEISASPILSESGQFMGYRGVGSDVTQQRDAAERIAFAANQDSITGLPNIRSLIAFADNELKNPRRVKSRVGVIAIGISNFNHIKSQFGYNSSEILLRDIVDRVKSLSDFDSYIIGTAAPDEIVIVIGDIDGNVQLHSLKSEVEKSLSRRFDIGQRVIDIKIKFGQSISVPNDVGGDIIARSLNDLYKDDWNTLKENSDNDDRLSLLDSSPSPGVPGQYKELFDSRHVINNFAPSAQAGVATLIYEHKLRLHNGPPEAIDEMALHTLQQLYSEIGNLISMNEKELPTETQIGIVATLSKRIFKFSYDTGELFVSGIQPLLASVPVAVGTMWLLQQVCGRELFETLGAGAAIAILGGYYGIGAAKAGKDEK